MKSFTNERSLPNILELDVNGGYSSPFYLNAEDPRTAHDIVVITGYTDADIDVHLYLPNGNKLPNGFTLIVKNGEENTSGKSITIQGYNNGSSIDTIDGETWIDISNEYESYILIWTGIEWNRVGMGLGYLNTEAPQPKKYGEGYYSGSQSISADDTYQDVRISVSPVTMKGVTIESNGSIDCRMTIEEAGYYAISYKLIFESTTTETKTVSGIIRLNDTTDVTQTNTEGFLRFANTSKTLTNNIQLIELSASDYIVLRGKVNTGSASTTIELASLTIERIDIL